MIWPGATQAKRLVTAALIGTGLSSFFFGWFIGSMFERHARPRAPDVARDYVVLVHDKMGDFYGTPLEGFAVHVGFWLWLAAIGLGSESRPMLLFLPLATALRAIER